MLTPFSVGYGETFVLQPYGENWRKQRRLVAQDFGQTMAPRYHSLQEKEARILVRNILKNPGNLVSQIKLYVTGLYMKENISLVYSTGGLASLSSGQPMVIISKARMILS